MGVGGDETEALQLIKAHRGQRIGMKMVHVKIPTRWGALLTGTTCPKLHFSWSACRKVTAQQCVSVVTGVKISSSCPTYLLMSLMKRMSAKANQISFRQYTFSHRHTTDRNQETNAFTSSVGHGRSVESMSIIQQQREHT